MRIRTIIMMVVGLAVAGAAVYALTRPVQRINYATVPTATPRPTPADQATLLFVGDIMLSRNVGIKIAASGDWRFPFLKIGDFLRSADLTFANLENPVSNRGIKVGSIYSFRADPRTLEGLTYAGIDVVSLANNHIWDYSREAFLDTMTHLAERGISYVGTGANFAQAHRGVTKTVKNTTVTFLAYTDLLSSQLNATATSPGAAVYDREQMIKDIKAVRAGSDLVVVSFHTGTEYETQHNSHQENIYRTAIDAGADLIVGHHPHVAQEVEPYKNGWIAYSLGNFIFDQYFSEETMRGLALQVTIKDKKITQVKSIPIGISTESQAYLK